MRSWRRLRYLWRHDTSFTRAGGSNPLLAVRANLYVVRRRGLGELGWRDAPQAIHQFVDSAGPAFDALQLLFDGL